ncbi:bacteriocin [Aquimarina sp. AU119]|nr:bacteriocin [Aquimarina sp. AU119]
MKNHKIEELSNNELTNISGGFGLLTLPIVAFHAGYTYYNLIH